MATLTDQRKYDHALVELMHAARITCVRCGQSFAQDDRVTLCPNAEDGGHALVPSREGD